MANLILSYRLKPETDRDLFERWVRQTDYPAMRGLARVKSFTNYRAQRLLVGEGAPAVDYIEIFEIDDLAGFEAQDMPGPVVQRIMGEFFQYVDNPSFVVVSEIK